MTLVSVFVYFLTFLIASLVLVTSTCALLFPKEFQKAWREMTKEDVGMKPCPFCGTEVDLNDEDVLHPSGVGWKERPEGFKSYHSFRDVPPEQWCWDMHCPTTAGGCGASISGDSKEEAIKKWNQRA